MIYLYDRIVVMNSSLSIGSYISVQDKNVQSLLLEFYSILKNNAPNAVETIKYGMPTFVGKKNLFHFGVTNHHLGFYPTPSAIIRFQKELSKYKTSKGAIQFPYDEPLPKALIIKMVQFRIKEDSALF